VEVVAACRLLTVLLAQPVLVEVLHLIAAQPVQEILLLQGILPVVPQVPILAVAVVELAKVNINHIREMVVLADQVL
jgi:hypothetical protein